VRRDQTAIVLIWASRQQEIRKIRNFIVFDIWPLQTR
jgi:hypothetical protein